MIDNYLSFGLFGILVCLLTVEAIVGGRPVHYNHEFPYQVSVQDRWHHHICGGGLLYGDTVLTAASCLVDHNGRFVVEHHYVVVGSIDLHEPASPAVTISVKRGIVLRDFNHTDPRHDFAVLTLTHTLLHPARADDPLWLDWPWMRFLMPASSGTIVGFGWNRVDRNRNPPSGSSHGRLKFAINHILPHAECQQAYSTLTIDDEYNFCARMEAANTLFPFGVCCGDTGGLLVHGHDQHATILGVLVRTSPHCDEKEGRGRPALYLRAVRFQEFVARAAVEIYGDNHVINYPL